MLKEIGYSEEAWLQIVRSLLKDVRVTIEEDAIEKAHDRWINNSSIKKGWGNIPAEMCDEILREISKPKI